MTNHRAFIEVFSKDFFKELSNSFYDYINNWAGRNVHFEFNRISVLKKTGCFKYHKDNETIEGEFTWDNGTVQEISYWHKITSIQAKKTKLDCQCSGWTLLHFGCKCGYIKKY